MRGAERIGPAGLLVVGLTGGLASGKSTFAAHLRAHGLPVIDADAVGHQLLDSPPPPLREAIAREFGELWTATGVVDRAALAREVFAAADRRQRLEALLHPAIATEIGQSLVRLAADHRVAVVELPLLFEAGWEPLFDLVVLVDCAPELQIERFCRRTGATPDEARQRLAAQMPNDEKRRLATIVIDNRQGPEQLEGMAAELAKRLREMTGRR